MYVKYGNITVQALSMLHLFNCSFSTHLLKLYYYFSIVQCKPQ